MGAPSPDRCLHRQRLIVMSRQPNEPGFDIRGPLFEVLGQDLTRIHGPGPSLAL